MEQSQQCQKIHEQLKHFKLLIHAIGQMSERSFVHKHLIKYSLLKKDGLVHSLQ